MFEREILACSSEIISVEPASSGGRGNAYLMEGELDVATKNRLANRFKAEEAKAGCVLFDKLVPAVRGVELLE